MDEVTIRFGKSADGRAELAINWSVLASLLVKFLPLIIELLKEKREDGPVINK